MLDQLAVLHRDDRATAYACAPSTIRARFGLETFRRMDTGSHTPIARSVGATVSCAEMVDPGRGFEETRGGGGETVDALYGPVDAPGSGRINRALTRPVSDPTAARLAGAAGPPLAAG